MALYLGNWHWSSSIFGMLRLILSQSNADQLNQLRKYVGQYDFWVCNLNTKMFTAQYACLLYIHAFGALLHYIYQNVLIVDWYSCISCFCVFPGAWMGHWSWILSQMPRTSSTQSTIWWMHQPTIGFPVLIQTSTLHTPSHLGYVHVYIPLSHLQVTLRQVANV